MDRRDLFVALALAAGARAAPAALSAALGISPSQAHYALRALKEARVVDDELALRRAALLEFSLHGARYAFPARLGADSLGVPTGIAAPLFPSDVARERPPVWPSELGDTRGPAVEPLSRFAPMAALRDPTLHRLLAAVDALRLGGARDAEIARACLERELA